MAKLSGLIAAAATPLLAGTHQPDLDKLVRHCARLFALGCDGINLLGTTGEATSFSVEQRRQAMSAIEAARLPLDRMMTGTGAASLADTITLTRHAADIGFAGALVLPPFYYKGIDDSGLERYFGALIDAVERPNLRLYLYNFPQNTGVAFSPELIEQLMWRHGAIIAGMKDSSGDLAAARRIASKLPTLDVFPSTEVALAELRTNTGPFAGVISATANITAPLAARALRSGEGPEWIARASAVRAALTAVPLVAAVKWTLADLTTDRDWTSLIPPLQPLDQTQESTLVAALARTEYRSLALEFRPVESSGRLGSIWIST